MPKILHDGVYKRCRCKKSGWGECSHPWHFRYHHGGKEHRFNLNAEAGLPRGAAVSKREARSLRNTFRSQIADGVFQSRKDAAAAAAIAAATPFTFGDVADCYLEKFVPFDKGRPRREAGRQLMEWYVNRLKDAEIPGAGGTRVKLADKPFTSITKADVEAVREHWPRKAGCAHGGNIGADRALKRLRHLCNWAIEEGYSTSTPFRVGPRAVIHFKSEKPRRRRLVGDEEQRLLDHANPLMKAIIIAAIDTACRPGELLKLQWRHVTLPNGIMMGRIDLPGEITKTGEPRTLPIVPNGRLAGVLEMRRLDPVGQPLSPAAYVFGNEVGEPIGDVRKEWRRTCDAAKITGLQFRDLRRESGSRLLERTDAAVHDAALMLGHADIRTTNSYLAGSVRRLASLMRRRDAEGDAFAQDSHNPPADLPQNEASDDRKNSANLLN